MLSQPPRHGVFNSGHIASRTINTVKPTSKKCLHVNVNVNVKVDINVASLLRFFAPQCNHVTRIILPMQLHALMVFLTWRPCCVLLLALCCERSDLPDVTSTRTVHNGPTEHPRIQFLTDATRARQTNAARIESTTQRNTVRKNQQ